MPPPLKKPNFERQFYANIRDELFALKSFLRFHWFMALIQKAATAGDPEARGFLAELGVPQEPVKAKPKRIKNDCVGVGCGRPLDPFPK